MTFSTYRTEDIDRKLRLAHFRPLDIMVAGVTGAGKSTSLNAFFQKTVATVGEGVDPETMKIDAYKLHDLLRLWDTPGLGDSIENDARHKKAMIDLLCKTYCLDQQDYGYIDLVIVIIDGACRDMGTTNILLEDVILPYIQSDRIIVAINQADFAMKGRYWNYAENKPEPQLVKTLEEKAMSVKRRVFSDTGLRISMPVYYSAKYGYHVKELFDCIITHIPTQRRSLLPTNISHK